MQKIQMTQEGYDNLKKEYDELLTSKRADTVKRLEKARLMGDLSENSEYTAAKEELSFVEGRVQELEMLLDNAEVVSASQSGKGIQIGCSVIVEKNGKNEEYAIVGEFEANPMERKLSSTSPIGKALMGKKIGETIEVEVPAGKLIYKVVEVKKA